MLAELHVSQLGVIEDVTVILGPGMTALTGETGAGKTLLVDAIELLLGGSAEPTLVRPGAAEATVEGRFVLADGTETIVVRVVPVSGRSRSYIDGRMANVQRLGEIGRSLVDLHGQHSQQSLFSPAAQRALLDHFAGIRVDEVAAARQAVRELEKARAGLGGDPRSRAREIELLRFQLEELDRAALESADEETELRLERDRLADAGELREAAGRAWAALNDTDEGIIGRLGETTAALAGKPLLSLLHDRLAGLAEELADAGRDARIASESFDDDPDRLAVVNDRLHLLADLRRKYGETLDEVIAFAAHARGRLTELESYDRAAESLEAQIADAGQVLADAERRLWEQRRTAAPRLSRAVQEKLAELAMPRATFAVDVGAEPPGDTVTWMLGANPGEPLLPLAKVASGGELARTMLAARLATGSAGGEPSRTGRSVDDRGSLRSSDDSDESDPTGGPATLVFDEVDAGIGGEAAVAVGKALALLGSRHQVLVVTHLPQVAAFADRHLVVRKDDVDGRTVASVGEVEREDRVVELSRMLSGRPGSQTARRHAEELLGLNNEQSDGEQSDGEQSDGEQYKVAAGPSTRGAGRLR